MCTLIVAVGVWPTRSLVVAANRDERLDRPAEGFARRGYGPLPVFAPRDLASGGTWMGLNAAGLFVGITNRVGSVVDPERRSRGLLVQDALGSRSAEAAADMAAAVDPTTHNPFHLILADRRRAQLVWSTGERIHREELAVGIHVVTERSFDAAPTRRPATLARALAELDGAAYPGVEWFQRLLATTDPTAPLEGVCVYDPALPYGTRSSTILEMGATDLRLYDHQGCLAASPTPVWVDLSTAARAVLGV